jgi:hypothetical protein
MTQSQRKFIDLDAMPADYSMLLDMSDGTSIRVRRTQCGGFVGRYLDGEFAFQGKPHIAGIGETFGVGDGESVAKVVGVRFERDQPPQPEIAIIVVANPLMANLIFVGGGVH